MNRQSGNALFLILIAVALFAGLSYAVTQSSRGGGNIDREQQMIDQAVSEQCNASINYAVDKLKLIGGCNQSDISYEINDTALGDKSCHVFEPAGGGVSPCGAYLAEYNCDLDSLEIGEKCEGADLVYAGTSGGNRLYTTAADQGVFIWNNGSSNWTTTGATSTTDGKSNTDTIVATSDAAAPYAAANTCRGIGNDWYLPAKAELNLLYTNQAAIGGFDSSARYWSSSEMDNSRYAWDQLFGDGSQSNRSKNNGLAIRCVRR